MPLCRSPHSRRAARPPPLLPQIQNPDVRNPVNGKPVAWKLAPGSVAPPMLAHPSSTHATRGAFATRHLWVTAYAPDEFCPAGARRAAGSCSLRSAAPRRCGGVQGCGARPARVHSGR